MAKEKPPYARIYDDPQRPGRKIIHVALGHGRFTRRRASADEAEAKAKEIVDRIKARYATDADIITLQGFYDLWWKRTIEPRNLAPKTLEDYTNTLSGHVMPDYGMYRMIEIDAPFVIDMFYAIEAEYSTSMAHRCLRRLHMVMDAARRWKYRTDNPVEDARKDLPSAQSEEKHVLTDAEIVRLYAAVRGTRYEALYHMALALGMRLGELLGFQWSAVDLEQNILHVRAQSQQVNGKSEFRAVAKTDASHRTLPIPPRLAGMLAALPRSGLWVFPNDDGGMWGQSSFGRHWRGGQGNKRKDGSYSHVQGVRGKAELPVKATPHSLRHTFSTKMLELGASEEIRAYLLGHSKRKTITQHYSHASVRFVRPWVQDLERNLLPGASDGLVGKSGD